MNSPNERRKHSRQPLLGTVRLLWEDRRQDRISNARCIDVSPSGVRFRVVERIPSRTIVLFNCPELGIAGRGTVRFCDQRKAAYEIGVECLCGTGSSSVFKQLTAEIGLPGAVAPIASH